MSTLERGFTLREVMLALTFGSLLALAAAKTLPTAVPAKCGGRAALSAGVVVAATGVRHGKRSAPRWVLRWAVRRAGAADRPRARRGAGSCVIVAYDINRSGQWASTGDDAGYFGYRLRQVSLEGQRGVSHCNENDWERVLDHHEVRIELFNVVVIKGNSGKTLARLTLAGCSTAESSIRRRLSWAIDMAALP